MPLELDGDDRQPKSKRLEGPPTYAAGLGTPSSTWSRSSRGRLQRNEQTGAERTQTPSGRNDEPDYEEDDDAVKEGHPTGRHTKNEGHEDGEDDWHTQKSQG